MKAVSALAAVKSSKTNKNLSGAPSKFKDPLQGSEETAGVTAHAVVLSQDNLQRGHRMGQVVMLTTTSGMNSLSPGVQDISTECT